MSDTVVIAVVAAVSALISGMIGYISASSKRQLDNATATREMVETAFEIVEQYKVRLEEAEDEIHSLQKRVDELELELKKYKEVI